MDIKAIGFGLGLAVAAAMIPGCAADVAAEDDGAAEEANTTQDELTANAQKIVGAFTFETGSRYPSFSGLVFKGDGTFFADVDTGIRCVRAPCPSSQRVAGRFSVTKNYISLLTPAPGQAPTTFHGRYKYSLAIGRETGVQKINLSRGGQTWTGWANTVNKVQSYCTAASDCDGQAIIHPMCVGFFTCTAGNTCGYKCGIAVPDVWPADAQKLVAQSPGGGFAPPAPPGSTCTIGQQKYTLDVATKQLSWEVCESTGAGLALHLTTGSRVISAAELAKIDKAADAVKLSAGDICGADKPMLNITVTSPAGTKTYTDSFYSCMGGSRTYVDHIDGVFGAMRDVAL
jgi:hypothetical protein